MNPGPVPFVELDLVRGIDDLAVDEAVAKGRRHGRVVVVDREPDRAILEWPAPIERLVDLRLAVAASVVVPLAVPRPKALLGDQHLRRVNAALADAVTVSGPVFTGLRLGMAGSGSAVAGRITAALAEAAGVPPDPDGDLFVRVRPSRLLDGGWDVVVRLTPRPLATRPWRLEHVRGALHGCIAAAMVDLVRPTAPSGPLVNLCSGTGSLLAEAAVVRWSAVGVDNDPAAGAAAAVNAPRAAVVTADATRAPFPSASFAAAVADPPWGTAVGSHEENAALYPLLLDEAARLVVPGGRVALLSHEVRLTGQVLAERRADWEPVEERTVFQKGHHPRLHVLRRRG